MADDNSVIAPGVPSWVDLGSPGVDDSVKFYGEVFGWTADEASAEFGGYRNFRLDGKAVAGVGPLQMEGQPAAWTTYVSVDDAAATTERVKAAGGTVFAAPMAVAGLGQMAIFGDPTGASFGVWQPGTFKGADLFNAPGAVVWNELGTRDLAAATAFYTSVFPWEGKAHADQPYTEWQVKGRTVAGMTQLAAEIPAEVPANWMTYFGIANLEAGMARVKELGGRVMMGPLESPFGPFAVMADPNGAVFTAMQLKE